MFFIHYLHHNYVDYLLEMPYTRVNDARLCLISKSSLRTLFYFILQY